MYNNMFKWNFINQNCPLESTRVRLKVFVELRHDDQRQQFDEPTAALLSDRHGRA
jgi:hypothetical protein